MNHSPATVLAAVLWQIGTFAEPPSIVWPLYAGTLPDRPDAAAACYTRSGNKDGRIMLTGETIVHPEVSFILRAIGKEQGWLKASALASACDAINGETVDIDGVQYLLQNASRAGDPMELGQEDNTTRWLWNLDVNVTVKQIS